MKDLDIPMEGLCGDDSHARHEAVSALAECGDEKVIPAMAGLLRDKDLFVRDIAYNALCASPFKGAVAEAVTPLVYDKDDVGLRNTAVEILYGLGPFALKAARRFLSEDDEDILKFGIDIMRNVACPEDAERELKGLLGHPNPNIRTASVVALGKCRAYGAADAVIKLLGDENEWVRFSAMDALGNVGGEGLIDKLLVAMDSDDISRVAAFDAASRLAGPEDYGRVVEAASRAGVIGLIDIDMLARFVEKFGPMAGAGERGILASALGAYLDDVDPYAQREALGAMALMGDACMRGPLASYAKNAQYDEETRAALRAALARCMDAPGVIEAARAPGENLLVFVEVLSDMADPASVPELKDIFDSTDDWRVRNAVIDALSAVGPDKGIDVFRKALSDEEGNVRRRAAGALAGFSDPAVVDILLEAIGKEPYDDVREAMAEVIASYSGEGADQVFGRLLESGEPFLRSTGVKGFSRTAPPDMAMRLALVLMKDDSPAVRCDALNAFRRADGAAALKAAASAMNDPAKEVRTEALDMLFEMDGGAPHIVEALSDADMWVRFKAAGMLCERPVAEAEDGLIRALEKDEIPVKVHAARALGAMRSKRSVALLKAFLGHDDEQLKEASREALSMCLV